ncbi:homologous recombination OB-fold protein [Onychomys torridus]|uniref:homologous recombination OB-fold protein n=1 Tax=Onychomys torridus TaxID=38674 RepID=UPI00167FCCC0|nr:homologous recombination OB-fold protein [Onychomys torridus]
MTHIPPEGSGKGGLQDEWIASQREGRRRGAAVPRLARVNFFPTSAVRGVDQPRSQFNAAANWTREAAWGRPRAHSFPFKAEAEGRREKVFVSAGFGVVLKTLLSDPASGVRSATYIWVDLEVNPLSLIRPGQATRRSRAVAMTCSLQKLFAVEEESEDEDFLSAVEKAEDSFTGALPGNAGHPIPVSSRPQEPLQTRSSRPLPSYPTSLSWPVPGLCLPTPSMPQTIRDPLCSGAASLRPVSVSSSSMGNQQRTTLTKKVLQESPGPWASAAQPGLIFGSHQQGFGGFEAPDQDEFDKALASMELEGDGLELELGVDGGATHIPPAQHHEDPVLAKKARVADLSGSFQKGPVIRCRSPGPSLRPRAKGSLPLPSALAVSTSHQRGSPGPTPQPLQVAGRPIQNSPQNHLPGQPFQSPRAWSKGTARFPGLGRPHCSSTVFPRGPLPSRASVSSVDSPVSTPRVPQPALQTPVVTNHLVQLVTATNQTPQQPSRSSVRAKTRRFPGPAGLLPHQQSGKNLEEIMVSTPQTPTHGALAKLQTENVASSQGSVEEDFGRGPWLTMKSALGLDEGDPTCFLSTYSIVMVLRKAALKQLPKNKVPNMAVMIKALTRSTMDASVVFKDPTGEMLGTVHRVLLETHQNELKPGSVLLLKQIGVFSPSLRNHYLNVTPNNLVHIYSLDSGDGDFLKAPESLPKDLGSFHGDLQPDVAAEPTPSLRAAQNSAVSPEEELPEADDLDGLLSELPEDFFCDPSWGCLKTGHPP